LTKEILTELLRPVAASLVNLINFKRRLTQGRRYDNGGSRDTSAHSTVEKCQS